MLVGRLGVNSLDKCNIDQITNQRHQFTKCLGLGSGGPIPCNANRRIGRSTVQCVGRGALEGDLEERDAEDLAR